MSTMQTHGQIVRQELKAVIHRADGTSEDLGTIAGWRRRADGTIEDLAAKAEHVIEEVEQAAAHVLGELLAHDAEPEKE